MLFCRLIQVVRVFICITIVELFCGVFFKKTFSLKLLYCVLADGFQLTSNPCQSGQGRVYYAVPGDATKFVQCDVLGRAYIVQCPAGLVYNQVSMTSSHLNRL